MGQELMIMDKEIKPLEYKGQRVLTLKMIDGLHERVSGTARKRFNENRERFIEGEDFFLASYSDWSKLNVRFSDDQNPETDVQNGGRRGDIIFLTESGYLMLTKSFTDKLAWQVQRALVRVYFAAKKIVQPVAAVVTPRRTIEIDEADFWKLKAEIAELKLEKVSRDYQPRRKPFTQEEEAEVIMLKGLDLSMKEIGLKLGRSPESIESLVRRLRKQGRV